MEIADGSMHPHARRVLLIPWSNRSASKPILRLISEGRIDRYATTPGRSPDEDFHCLVTELLQGWRQQRPDRPTVVTLVDQRWAPRDDRAQSFRGGAELCNRALDQAWSFGAETSVMRAVTDLRAEGDHRTVVLADRAQVTVRAVVLATGASYQRVGASQRSHVPHRARDARLWRCARTRDSSFAAVVSSGRLLVAGCRG